MCYSMLMPSRNLLRVDVPDGYYHVYTRGVNSRTIFRNDQDFRVFLNLLKRYLSVEVTKDGMGRDYPHLYGQLELLCYCLMPNHVHLFVYQAEQGALEQLMRCVMTSYSRYFNKTYERRGPLFESRYKASLISIDPYFEHISRYIHLNPKDWGQYSYSSLSFFVGDMKAEWIMPGKILGLFKSTREYVDFLQDYADHKLMLDQIRDELATA